MNSDSHDQYDLQQLLGELAEGSLSEEQFRALEKLLTNDRGAREEYRRYLQLHAMLHFEHGLQASGSEADLPMDADTCNLVDVQGIKHADTTITNPRPSSKSVTSRKFVGAKLQRAVGSWKLLACMLALAVSVGAAGMEAWHRHNGKQIAAGLDAQPGGNRSSVAPVAFLTSANGCNWSGVTPLLHTVGSSVQMGDELALHEGVAEFRMANGVYLGLEGPASLLLVSPSKVVLQYGKLTTHVPWGVTDFQVVAGACRVNTRDAEFGLSRMGNKLDIHVFSGEANVASSVNPNRLDDDGAVDELTDANGTGYFTEAAVTTGRALSLTSHGELLTIGGWSKAKPNSFVTKLSMSGPLPVTQDYVNQVLTSKPIAYWRFEQVIDSEVRNEVESGMPLIVKDKSLLVGGDGNLSAELRSDGDWYFKGKSRLPLAESEYSIEVWVKPSHLHLGSIVNLECADLFHSGARLELEGGSGDSYGGHPGELRYVHRTYKGKEHDFGISCFTSRPYAVRRWQHVVAVKTESEMKLYLDGKLSMSAKEGPELPSNVKVTIGRFNGGDLRQFVGQIDELAIYNHALSEKEIAQHYKTVKRATETSKANVRREQLDAKSAGA